MANRMVSTPPHVKQRPMPNVVCMGELLIDFVPTEAGVTLAEAEAFKKAPGGAPANVAVGLARLGVSACFMGKVGDDDFGRFLAQTLVDNGVDTTPLVFSAEAHTALAFVSLSAQGERDFMFYRHPSADMLFEPSEVREESFQSARIFHYGSISLIGEPSRGATLHAIRRAEEAGCLISYDPNLRLPLWPGKEEARAGLMKGWESAEVVKASAEEIAFLTGARDVESGVRRLWHPRLKLVTVTEGAAGCRYTTGEASGQLPGFPVEVVDTTGAGDGFVAGLLAALIDSPALWEDVPALEEALRFANAVGALTTTQLGAIPALPTRAAVEAFLASSG
jgi:fructokinase